jgi:hypothetical protein
MRFSARRVQDLEALRMAKRRMRTKRRKALGL